MNEEKKLKLIKIPEYPAMRYLRCLLMPNGEVLFLGKSLGFVNTEKDSINQYMVSEEEVKKGLKMYQS